jgi:uncharacterized protein YbjT (DUF2867 family)
MSRVLAVFGATGHQGSSVINNVLNDPELSQQYSLRAITRDVNSTKAKQLQDKGVQVVAGDVTDRSSIESALAGAHTIFAMTAPDFSPNAVEVEFSNAKTIADVAVSAGAQYLIWSTLPYVSKISGGKYSKVTAFDAKAKAEEYIRGLKIKSAFFSGGFFMENFQEQPFLSPKPGPDGVWTFTRPNSPNIKVPFYDAVSDTGKFVGAILAEPDKFEGKVLHAAQGLYTMEELAVILGKALGKKVAYKQAPLDEFVQGLPFAGDLYGDAFAYLEEFGYFGPETETLVAWTAENVRGKLTTFEEFFAAHPLALQ